jgi:transposase InsO family protein
VLTIVDTFSRFSPALEPRFTFRGTDVVEVLERVGRQVGFPATIRVDQGTAFVSRDLDLWAYQRGSHARLLAPRQAYRYGCCRIDRFGYETSISTDFVLLGRVRHREVKSA